LRNARVLGEINVTGIAIDDGVIVGRSSDLDHILGQGLDLNWRKGIIFS
jgi:hypothetical protein